MIKEVIDEIFLMGIPNYFISRKIDYSVYLVQGRIDRIYYEYRNNIIILAVLNGLFLMVSVLSSFAIVFREVGIVIAAILLLVLCGRTLYLLIRGIKTVLEYRYWIQDFLSSLIKNRSFQISIRNLLKDCWLVAYGNKTNLFTKNIHSLCATYNLVKSANEIEELFVERHYRMIREYFIQNIICKTLVILLLYGAFVFLIQPFLVHFILGMNILEILIYPVRIMGWMR